MALSVALEWRAIFEGVHELEMIGTGHMVQLLKVPIWD
jgi:hypothetical protein